MAPHTGPAWRPTPTRVRDAGQWIARRVAFTGGGIHGEQADPGTVAFGRLPTRYTAPLRESLRHGGYVVYSYRTPIAWWTEANGWTAPPEFYSPTTCRYQSIVHTAIGVVRRGAQPKGKARDE